MFDLRLGDCLELMADIPDGSVDMILTDPPYGITACKWDSVIPLEPMWEQLSRVVKPNGAIVMTASQPFAAALVMSNVDGFKHEWIWQKNRGSNFASVKYQPMKEHEAVLVFERCGSKVNYFPIKEGRKGGGASRVKYAFNDSARKEGVYGNFPCREKDTRVQELRFPGTVQKFNTEVGFHPTQKPVALMEYLIKTYTNEGETVLDFTMGSGTTGVACANTGRKFIGIERDPEYFEIARSRIEQAHKAKTA